MSLSMVARSTLRSQRIAARGFKSSAPAHSAGHGEYHHLPFQLPGKRKLTFGVKVAAFLLTGFSIPFIASYHQIQKSKGA